MVKDWPKLSSQPLGDYRVFRLRQDRRRSPRTGRDHTFYVLESNDWINVIPITPAGQVVLIRQFRHGIEQVTLEIPGGMVDNGETDPAGAAARELREETGYAAESLIPIGVVTPNPAILNNHCHTYLAHNARQVSKPHFDGSEDIALELVDLAQIPHLIRSGGISHGLVIAAFDHYDQYRRR